MTNTKRERIIEALRESNKWWFGKFELDFKPREIHDEIKKFLTTRQIIALTGLRRVGKTTIMYKIVNDFTPKFDAKNILYFSFDDFKDIRIKEVINTYAEIMNKDTEKESYLFLFDEIQKLADWEEQIKRIYDNFKDIKIIISGSESLFIRKKSKESLAGRVYEFKIKQLSFREYLTFKGLKIGNIELYKEDILREFNYFLFTNGFPEIINESIDVIKKYIWENIIEKVIYKDIPQVFPIKDPVILGEVLKIILKSPGEIINIEELSKDLGISRQTISNYLNYLEKSFLIRILYNFSRNARKTQRKLKRYYPTIILPEIIEKSEFIGKVFETAIVLQLDAEFFWRDAYKHEVDIVLINKNEILPIEVKYSKIETKSLIIFARKFKLGKGTMITYNKKEQILSNKVEISVVPFYEYILKSI